MGNKFELFPETGYTGKIVSVTYVKCRSCKLKFLANITEKDLQEGGGRIERPCPNCQTKNSFVSTTGEMMSIKDEPILGEDPEDPSIIVQNTKPRQ